MTFDSSIKVNKCDFSQSHAFVTDTGVCSLKPKENPGWGQNPDLFKTYDKLIKLSMADFDTDMNRMSIDQLKNVSHYIHGVYSKIDKSQLPPFFFIKIYNLFAACFGKQKIEIYDYSKKSKLLDLSNRIKAFISAKDKKPPVTTQVVIQEPEPSASHPAPSSSNRVVNPSNNKVKQLRTNLPKQIPEPALARPEPDPVIDDGPTLDELQHSRDYDALLDKLKTSYKADFQEELERLRYAGVYTSELEHTFNKNVNIVEKQKGINKFNREEVKVAVGRSLEIKKYLKRDYYVINHSQDTRFVVLTYLIKEMVRSQYSKEQLHHYKFLRHPSDRPVPIATYTKGGRVHDHDPATRRALVSCDGYFFNTTQAESSLYFLSNNNSVATYGGDSFITNIAQSLINQIYPSNYEMQRRLQQVVVKYVNEIGAQAPMGTLHVFCLPKDKAITGEFASLYRSHPYGVACDCPIKSRWDEKTILEKFQDDILTPDLKCSSYGSPMNPQYRIIAPNLKPQDGVKIKTFTPLDKVKRHEIKKAFRDAIRM